MKKTGVGELRQIAKELASSGKKWHFHILTPECQLNDSDKCAFVLENADDNEAWVCYSDQPQMDLGKELVKLLHGNDVVKGEGEEIEIPPSPQVKELLKRASDLNRRGKFWHHHMLFPGCRFNKYKGKYVIVFEDQEKGEIIESVSDGEPKCDLQHIERLFYSQKRKV